MRHLTHDYTTTPHVYSAELWMENSSAALESGDVEAMAAQVGWATEYGTIYNDVDKKIYNDTLNDMARRMIAAGKTDGLAPKWVKIAPKWVKMLRA